MIKIVIVDDEKLAIQELTYILSKVSYVQIIGSFTDARDALQFVMMEEPDVVFLDINMPVLNGIKFTEQLRQRGMRTQIIFATAYDEYAIKAFDHSALDYILKPYEAERIYQALHKVRKSNEPEAMKEAERPRLHLTKYPVWRGEKMLLIDISDILYCEVENNKVKMVTTNDVFELSECLSNLEEKLPSDQFFKTHRSFIVNLTKITEVSPYFNNTLILKLEKCKAEIPVSRNYLKNFKSLLNIK